MEQGPIPVDRLVNYSAILEKNVESYRGWAAQQQTRAIRKARSTNLRFKFIPASTRQDSCSRAAEMVDTDQREKPEPPRGRQAINQVCSMGFRMTSWRTAGTCACSMSLMTSTGKRCVSRWTSIGNPPDFH